MKRVVAVLDTMWGEPGRAPRFFNINPYNCSGKRLYSLLPAGTRLVVTNCCKELVSGPNFHGTPDAKWLEANLRILSSRVDLVLVCGRIAAQTFEQIELKGNCAVFHIDHPAARRWTAEKTRAVRKQIQKILRSGNGISSK